MNEGTSQPTPRYTADSEDIFVFKAKSEEPFPPKKRCWFTRSKSERRKRMRSFQQQRIVNRERNTQNPETRPYGKKNWIGN
ncbi:hypothetical protein Hanom_Chr00s000001g01593221 [Helianthus anomalus]